MVLLWRSGMEQYSTLCFWYLVDGAWYSTLILCVDGLALWKIINMPSWSQKVEGRNFSEGFCTLNFLDGVNYYAATPLIVALSLGHSDKTRFCPWSPIAPDWKSFSSSRKNSKFAQTTGNIDVFHPRSGISGPTWCRASACANLHEWWTQPADVRCPVAQL